MLGLEVVPDLVDTRGREPPRHRPHVGVDRAGGGRLPSGAGDRAPYDRILVSAAARTLPEELVGQLVGTAAGWSVPVAGTMLLVPCDRARTA